MPVEEGRQAVDLSVVVAVRDAGESLRECLAGMSAELAGHAAEVIVVDGSGNAERSGAADQLPEARFLEMPAETSVPKLWQAGIAASSGRIVALTIEHCVPGPGWADQILRAHSAQWPAIGGAIDLDPTVGRVDTAVYFCRYSSYMPPFPTAFRPDLAGDNCSYKRAALEEMGEELADGFWETFVHQSIRNRGGRLLASPAILLYYVGPTGASDFLKTRFAHGRYFASRRAQTISRGQRFLRAAAFPAVPLLMLSRIASRVWIRRRHRGRFLSASPILLSFLVAWSAGELVGYLLGAPRERLPGKRRAKALHQVG